MGRRTEHMEFLRDRMIEAGRIGNRVEVVDLALAFKDPSQADAAALERDGGPGGAASPSDLGDEDGCSTTDSGA